MSEQRNQGKSHGGSHDKNRDRKQGGKSDRYQEKKTGGNWDKKSDRKSDGNWDRKPDRKSDGKTGGNWDRKPERKSDGNWDRKPDRKSDGKTGGNWDRKPDRKSDGNWDRKPDRKSDGNWDRKPDRKPDRNHTDGYEKRYISSSSDRDAKKTYGQSSSKNYDGYREKRTDESRQDARNIEKDGAGRRGGYNKPQKRENVLGDCIYARSCGACQYQGLEYKKQLKRKQKLVEELMGDIVKVEKIIGMENPFHYRNKVNATFGRLRNGTILSGIYKEGTHEVVDIAECQIEDQRADAIIQDIKKMIRSFKIKTYDEDSEYGLLRHVLVRTGHVSGEVMVVLVLASPILPSKNNFVKALRKLHPEISTVVINVNEKRTSMVLGQRNITLYGKGYIEDTLCGLTFRISPSSFYQINSVQTEVLYNKAMDYAALTGNEKVIDAYCGIGTIGMVAATHAAEVIGVELNASAVRDASINAKRNNMKHITFYNQDAGEFLVELAEKQEHVDVVFMDPPRSGSTEVFIDAVAKLAPKKVVYISCDPETLARDLRYFAKKGYSAKECQPVDMFPFTEHCENVCLLMR